MKKRGLVLLCACLMTSSMLSGCGGWFSVSLNGEEVVSVGKDKDESAEEKDDTKKKSDKKETEKESKKTEKDSKKKEDSKKETEKEVSSDGLQMDGVLVSGYKAMGYVEMPEQKTDMVIFVDKDAGLLSETPDTYYLLFTCSDENTLKSFDESIFGDSEAAGWVRQTVKAAGEQLEKDQTTEDFLDFKEGYMLDTDALVISSESDGLDMTIATAMPTDDALIMAAVSSETEDSLSLLHDFVKKMEWNEEEKDFSEIEDLGEVEEFVEVAEMFNDKLLQTAVDLPEVEEQKSVEDTESARENLGMDISPSSKSMADLVAEMLKYDWYQDWGCKDGTAIVGAMTLHGTEALLGLSNPDETSGSTYTYGQWGEGQVRIKIDEDYEVVDGLELHAVEGKSLASVDEVKDRYGEPTSTSDTFFSYDVTSSAGTYGITFFLDDNAEFVEWIDINCYPFD